MKDLRLADEAENTGSDDDPGQEFPEDCRLADSLHALARRLRRQPDDNQTEQQFTELDGRARYCRSPSESDVSFAHLAFTSATDPQSLT